MSIDAAWGLPLPTSVTFHSSLTIPFRLDSASAFERIISTWREVAPGLLPTHAQSDEPVRHVFNPDDLDDGFQFWMNQFWFARRKSPRLSADVLTGGFTHSYIGVDIERSGRATLDELQRLLLALAAVVRPDYGMLHALSAPEIAEARTSGRPDLMTINRISGKSSIGAGYAKQLAKGIPTLFWGNLFGPPYVDLIGRERLLAAPAAIVREETWGVYMQVSEDPPSDDTWATFRARRNSLMAYLGRDAFFPGATRIASTMHDFMPPPLPIAPRT